MVKENVVVGMGHDVAADVLFSESPFDFGDTAC